MKRYKVGETFEYEGMILKAVEDHFNQVDRGCKCCALRKLPLCTEIDCGTIDSPYIHFVKVSKEELLMNALPIIQDVPVPPLEDDTNFLDDLDLKPKKKSLWDYLKLLWNKIK